MDFYPAKNNDRLNRVTFQPETIGGRVMVNPRYPIRELAPVAPWWCERCGLWHTFPCARVDSGAFQDIGKRRFFPWSALSAQLELERRLRFLLNDDSFHFETVFIYDNPAGVDEAVLDGKKIKVRGTLLTARAAVEDTVAAAAYYATRRADIAGRIGWVGQGIDADQYEGCVRRMLGFMQADDVFAFGGFCIWGRMPARMTATAHEAIARVIPLVRDATGITRFHLLGVMYAPGVEWAADLARRAGVNLATDGSGPEQAACIGGRVYDGGRQTDGGYRKEHKYKEYHPCELAHRNIRTYHEWSQSL